MAMSASKCSAPSITAESLGISTQKPKFPEYAILTKRLESFEKLPWPKTCPVRVQDLAEAGLVNTGVEDCVRCYFCGGGLRNWEAGDKPLEEHARWYPSCGHLVLVRGHKFAQEIERENDTGQPLKNRNKVENDVENIAISALIENGFKRDDVSLAVRLFRKRNERKKFSAGDLFNILMEIEENPNLLEETKHPNDSFTEVDLDEKDIEKLKEENSLLRDEQSCKICLENLSDIVFLPCGHMVSCGQCAPAISKCPLCRKYINGYVKAIFVNSDLLPDR